MVMRFDGNAICVNHALSLPSCSASTVWTWAAVEQLKRLEHDRPQSARANHRTTLAAYFPQHPPVTVTDAAAKIAEVTGMVRKATQVRQFLRALGMQPMQVDMLPAKADVEAPEAFKKRPGA